MVPMAVVTRNIFCPNYSHCLDKAAKQNAPSWECDRCEHRNARDGIINETEFTEFFLLLWAVFRPELYHKYREAQRQEAFERSRRTD